MFIKSVIIDGFKSYGTRTEINGFDPEFNAITGLNGTGKSNILDSICFVLGISNLTHVRANSMQDLIYKSGQAGVTKATVTIVFDNRDKHRSPINYEQYDEITVSRQIIVAGKTRFMINGVSVNNKALTDFFSSVQLNVNNPHFLIMQGRITKVLNMKPPEILSMIEEAAGTRMYENKKIGAQKTIEKKDCKLKEMDDMVAESITPKLQKLKEEKTMYVEYMRIQKELEQLTRVYKAYQYLNLEQFKETTEKHIEEHKEMLEATRIAITEGNTKVSTTEKKIEELQAARDAESGGRLGELEKDLKKSNEALVRAESELKNLKSDLTKEAKKQKELEKAIVDDEKALENKKAGVVNAQTIYDGLVQAEKNEAEAAASAQKRIEAIYGGGGGASDDAENASLQEQAAAVATKLKDAEAKRADCDMNRKELKIRVQQRKANLKKTEMEFARDKKELDKYERDLQAVKTALEGMNYEEGLKERLVDQIRNLEDSLRTASGRLDDLVHRNARLIFEYSDPEPNFDRRKVRGLVCKLFQMKDQKFSRAVETTAEGRLFNVVVDDESISAKLIKKGNLRWRTTFAPLNRVRGHQLDQRIIRKADEVAGRGNVFLAQALVDYDPEYEAVMRWCFGQTFVCMTTEAAKKIAFHPEIRTKAIDLEGNVFNPQGVISGGAVDKSTPILTALVSIVKGEEQVNNLKAELRALRQKLDGIAGIAASYESTMVKYEMCSREVQRVKDKLQGSSHCSLQREIDELEANLQSYEERYHQHDREVNEYSVKSKDLENQIKNLKATNEKALADAQAARSKAKKKEAENRLKREKYEKETLSILQTEITALEQSSQRSKDELQQSLETIAQLKESIEKQAEELKIVQETHQEKASVVKALKNEIGQKDTEIKKMVAEKDKTVAKIGEDEMKLKSLTNKIEDYKKQIEGATHELKKMKKEYRWIEQERQYFGEPGGIYDFSVNDPKIAGKKIEQLNASKETIGRHVNPKAMEQLGNQEEQFREVMNKKTIIEEDRSKILSVIDELDVKKEEVIRKAWEKVNQDFNSIFSSLLPTAQAKLKPVDGKSFMDGLEVKVGFGGLWKDSLDELSGGQRSLVALSLILAMLLFKPAPLYILDEVDAALDPSHTQNIGQMLKAHFKQSQFIVVSLKDGMFNNANVLFRTNFVDGMSAVSRTTGGGASR
ncbi:structural maintenance of chromosomes protein [Nesidiocoris tenuis]|uniref:Structural maintenance of chromosomes protein n=1 Tax=Nesidiocoris tenuis TaxID=355587 RepID=A0ABN7A777_9HEMI|nr:structural maintenance of chromosomes protein [Nesidiocoris tenuis]